MPKIALPENLKNDVANSLTDPLQLSRAARKTSIPVGTLRLLSRTNKIKLGAYSLAPSLGNA